MKLGRALRSSTVRFVALVFALQVGAAALLLLVVNHVAAEELQRVSRSVAIELRDDLVSSFDRGGMGGLQALAETRLTNIARNEDVILITGPKGRIIAGNIGAWPPNLAADGAWRSITLYRIGTDRPERMIASAIRLPDGSRLLAGHVEEGRLQLAGAIEEAMAGAFLLALPIALLGAMLAGRVINARVSGIAATVQAVRGGDLSRRVQRDGSGDAFEQLGGAINAMLDRIEALVTELRIITDGLAHDLRSPLTRLTASVETALAEARDERSIAALQAVSAEADALQAMLATALQISRAEAEMGTTGFVTIDLAAMLSDLVEVYGPLAEERGFTLDWRAEGDVRVAAHRELFGQALANLVDNALKYAGGGPIRLRAERGAEAITVGVADAGPGIAADRREEALRRFGRLDPSRGSSGAGLGLSLVAAVARLHGGELILADADPGLEVIIRLPLD